MKTLSYQEMVSNIAKLLWCFICSVKSKALMLIKVVAGSFESVLRFGTDITIDIHGCIH